ncbi:serine/threonine-protein kinase [Enhygromyxa salina]|uniref:Serine/threonine-protein kinase PK-1 n=1 Tax=Enhygromyxa salina TaxID=215803 RepID=A0A2S9YQB9_9BACT|nr:serine/threonine-protein kinase [Enhygromyxa salina]PRQ07291.1 Serine/threonine-protein kinase PK-1 [Enhygromyxa salina]
MSESAHLHPDLEALVGATLHDRYRVDSLLGVGGMGAVFKARHTGLDRDVAIKVLHPEIGRDASVSKRFDREATSASRLDHPNCVRVTDFGTTEDGTKYLVMELLAGSELEARLGHAWSPAATIDTAKQILAGLEHAHHFGIVHRDLKPENVFITTDFRGDEIAKLVDFGIAKLLDERGTEKLTRQGIVFGTPRYMSPEQAAGGKVDARTDLYAAGLIFYEMLAGRPPFTSDDPAQLLRMQIMEVPPPLPETVPRALVSVVDKLLEKSKMDRFADAREAIEALEAAASLIAAASAEERAVEPVGQVLADPAGEPVGAASGVAWQPAPAPVRTGATVAAATATVTGARRASASRTGSHAGIGQPATGAFESLGAGTPQPAGASTDAGGSNSRSQVTWTASHPAPSAGVGVSVTAPIVASGYAPGNDRARSWVPLAAAGVALLLVFTAIGLGMMLFGDHAEHDPADPNHKQDQVAVAATGDVTPAIDAAPPQADPPAEATSIPTPAPGPTRPPAVQPERSPAAAPSGSPKPRRKAADADDSSAATHEKNTPTGDNPADGTAPADESTSTVTDAETDTTADRARNQAEDDAAAAERREHEAAKQAKKASKKAKGKDKDKDE